MAVLVGIFSTIVLGLITTAIVALIVHIYNKFIPIIVSPKSISLKTNEWDIKSIFKVQNRTDSIFYSVWVKLALEGMTAESNAIEVSPEKSGDFVVGNMMDISVGFEVIRIDGTDAKTKECVFLILYNLDPKQTKSFIIKLKGTAKSIDKQQPKILLKEIDHSLQPQQYLTQKDNKIAFPFKPPENIKIKALSLLMKKK